MPICSYARLKRAAEVQISMDGRGRALDNVFVERLWRSVKYEEVYLKDYASVPEASTGLGQLRVLQSRAAAPGAGVSDASGGIRRGPCTGARRRPAGMLIGGRGHVEISQTRFPQAHTLHRSQRTKTTGTTLTYSAPEIVQRTGSTSHLRRRPGPPAAPTLGPPRLQRVGDHVQHGVVLEQRIDPPQPVGPQVIEKRRIICGGAYAFQGDERSVIFLSMVAAPGERRIGALTTQSARQRFNVAVSRAQDQLWLHHTAQLDVLSDACMRHRLLSYMLDPTRHTAEEGEQRFDSDFERDVFRLITERGFHVRTQVAVGDPANHRFRIDLVVEGMQGRLAVECDGDEWHGIERYEHDMARQRDLERAGWQFSRIRGGDFYRDQVTAMDPVWQELDRLGIRPGGIDEAAAGPPAPARGMSLEGRETTSMEAEANDPPAARGETEFALAPPAEVPRTPRLHLTDSSDGVRPDAPETPTTARVSDPSPRPLPKAQPAADIQPSATHYTSFDGDTGPDPRQGDLALVAEGLSRIVEVEGQILVKRSYDIYLRGCGIRRMGGELKRTMNQALQRAIRKGWVVLEDESGKGGLVYSVARSTGAPPVLVRDRGPRDFEEIPPSELQLVARRLSEDEGLEPGSDAHLRAVLDFFDLKRLTVQVGTTLLEILGRQYPYVDEMLGQDKR